MNKENCALKLVNEIILYYDAPSKKHQSPLQIYSFSPTVHILRLAVLSAVDFAVQFTNKLACSSNSRQHGH